MKIIVFYCFILFLSMTLNSQEYFRSNYNGLSLLKIDQSKLNDYKYYLKIEKTGEGVIERKTLFENGISFKRWDYTLIDGKMREEYYYVNGILNEKSEYNDLGHKIKLIEYKNNNKIRVSEYLYNKDGLVSDESIQDLILNKFTKLKYIYDFNYQIKQIIKQIDNSTTIYWDVIFTAKGIVNKEYYSLDNERYIFYYNKNGQEFKGEIFEIKNNNEIIKKKWDIFYTKEGKLFKRDEYDIINKFQKIIYYDGKARDIKTEYFENNELIKVSEKIYDNDDNLIASRLFVGINIEENKYYYDKEKNLIKTEFFKDGKIKVREVFLEKGKKREMIFSDQGYIINRDYDEKGDFIKEFVTNQ